MMYRKENVTISNEFDKTSKIRPRTSEVSIIKPKGLSKTSFPISMYDTYGWNIFYLELIMKILLYEYNVN